MNVWGYDLHSDPSIMNVWGYDYILFFREW